MSDQRFASFVRLCPPCSLCCFSDDAPHKEPLRGGMYSREVDKWVGIAVCASLPQPAPSTYPNVCLIPYPNTGLCWILCKQCRKPPGFESCLRVKEAFRLIFLQLLIVQLPVRSSPHGGEVRGGLLLRVFGDGESL